jgi:methylated-DNA-[protein]-cysteine S-methyltransferase
MTPKHLVRTTSPLGRIEVTSDGTVINTLRIERDNSLPHDGLPETSHPLLVDAVEQLQEYFAGTRRTFDLPLRLEGTAFQSAIWSTLQQIGWGESASYGELAQAAGWPGSARAVGGAVGANPVPILVGCHRVLSSKGHITGYSAGNGVVTKVWLLEHESIGHA